MINDYAAAVAIGLAGAGHCLGMCGGIAAAISLGGGDRRALTFAYHAGRVCSYTLLGAAIGFLAGTINLAAWTIGLRYLAGLLLVAMGLYVADWWRGLLVLERAGALLWRPVQRLSSRLLPVRRSAQGFTLGLAWGLMPCGLIYSALAWAATAQSAGESAVLMLLFGIGTLPAMLATSFSAGGAMALLRRRGLKVIIALLLIASGLWSLGSTYLHAGHLLHKAPGASATHLSPGDERATTMRLAKMYSGSTHAMEDNFSNSCPDRRHAPRKLLLCGAGGMGCEY